MALTLDYINHHFYNNSFNIDRILNPESFILYHMLCYYNKVVDDYIIVSKIIKDIKIKIFKPKVDILFS